MTTKIETSGQPIEPATGPAEKRPAPKSVSAPDRIEMMVKEIAKFENPPIAR